MIDKVEFIEKLISNKSGALKWTDSAMRAFSVAIGIDALYYQVLFPDGVREVCEHYHRALDQKMLEILAGHATPDKVREKIALALKVRIIEIDDSDCSTLIGRVATWNTVDVIWAYAGDNSADFNFYTKRGLLYVVYTASKKYYANDRSENFVDTELYIKNAIARVLKIAQLKSKLPKMEDIPIIRLFS